MSKLDIRPIRKEEYPQVVELIRQVMLEVNIKDYDEAYLQEYVKRYDDRELAAFVESPGCHFYVAYLDGELAACGAVAPSEEMRGAMEIRSVYVRPDVEGVGIGREIMAVLEGDSAFLTARWVVVRLHHRPPLLRQAGLYLCGRRTGAGGERPLLDGEIPQAEKVRFFQKFFLFSGTFLVSRRPKLVCPLFGPTSTCKKEFFT